MDFERSFDRLADVPLLGAAGHDNAMRTLTEEVVSGDTLGTYPVVSNTPNGMPRVTVLHSMARYSAGFGGQAALHGKVIGLMGEMVGDQLPPKVRFSDVATENLMHAFALENVTNQPAESVTTHYDLPNASDVMDWVPEAEGGVPTTLCCLCPIPLMWAPYFLNFKTPFEAYSMGVALVATLGNDAERNRPTPFVDWLRASTQRLGPVPLERIVSVLD